MWESFKRILFDRDEAINFIEDRGDDYHDILSNESDSQSEFDAGVVSTLTEIVNTYLPSIRKDLLNIMAEEWIKERARALNDIRNNNSADCFPKAILELIETESISTCKEEILWHQGYLEGYRKSTTYSNAYLKEQIDLISNKI